LLANPAVNGPNRDVSLRIAATVSSSSGILSVQPDSIKRMPAISSSLVPLLP
jgi:hypothetical protein